MAETISVQKDLVTKTNLLFKDGKSELGRSYNGLISFVVGDKVKVEEPFYDEEIGIRAGNYVVTERTAPDRMRFNYNGYKDRDLICRYIKLERES